MLYLSITSNIHKFPWHHLQPPPATRSRHLACLQRWEQSAVTTDHDHYTPGPFLANFHVNYLGKTRAGKTETGKVDSSVWLHQTRAAMMEQNRVPSPRLAPATQTRGRGASSSVETCPEVSLQLRITPHRPGLVVTVLTGDALNLRQLISRHASKFWLCLEWKVQNLA